MPPSTRGAWWAPWAIWGVFSLMGGKHHSAGGQGGMVITNNEDYYWDAKRFADRGKPFNSDGAQEPVPGPQLPHDRAGGSDGPLPVEKTGSRGPAAPRACGGAGPGHRRAALRATLHRHSGGHLLLLALSSPCGYQHAHCDQRAVCPGRGSRRDPRRSPLRLDHLRDTVDSRAGKLWRVRVPLDLPLLWQRGGLRRLLSQRAARHRCAYGHPLA